MKETRRPRWRWFATLLGLPLLGAIACNSAGAGPPPRDDVALERIATGLDDPVHLTAIPGDPRLFVVEQPGRIRVIEDGEVRDEPFLDIAGKVRSGGERGLLSLAFHPSFESNGFFFVNYTERPAGRTVVERYRVASGGSRADPSSGRVVLAIDQPYGNHNGGHVLFDHRGLLWIGMGDGGAANDPQGNGQNLESLLGAMLRVDVDAREPYAIPAGNPFAAGRHGRPEIWASGVRNPWRFWIDAADTLVYIADVGQNEWEEIHVERADRPGLNYGWNVLEGSRCFRGRSCDRAGMQSPLVEYSHGEGCSITGGVVYRGKAVPALRGHYLYADYCQGWIRSFRYADGRTADHREWRIDRPGSISSFGVDGDGEAYVVTLEGDVFKVVSREGP